MPRYFVYARASTEMQTDSIQQQLDIVNGWIDSHQEYLAAFTHGGTFCDQAVSGGVPILCRPAGREMVMQCKPGDIIVVANFFRAFRSVADCATMLTIFQERGIKLEAINSNISITTPEGEMMCNVMASYAQFERRLASSRVSDAIVSRQRRGMFVTAPRGWKRRDEGKRKRDRKAMGEFACVVVPDIPMRENVGRLVFLREKYNIQWDQLLKVAPPEFRKRPDGEPWTLSTLFRYVAAMKKDWPMETLNAPAGRRHKTTWRRKKVAKMVPSSE